MRRLWRALALVALALWPFAIVGARPPLWQYDYHEAQCWGPCCLITRDFFEVSCGEYSAP